MKTHNNPELKVKDIFILLSTDKVHTCYKILTVFATTIFYK